MLWKILGGATPLISYIVFNRILLSFSVEVGVSSLLPPGVPLYLICVKMQGRSLEISHIRDTHDERHGSRLYPFSSFIKRRKKMKASSGIA